MLANLVCCIPLQLSLDIAMSQFKACCESIARSGFGILQIPDAMLQDYKKIIDGYSAIPQAIKDEFSFAQDTDGFSLLAPSTPCRGSPGPVRAVLLLARPRFKRTAFEFTRSTFVAAVGSYERQMSELAQGVMDGICAEFGVQSLAPFARHRTSSCASMVHRPKTVLVNMPRILMKTGICFRLSSLPAKGWF